MGHKRQGFTLIELLIVIVVIGILGGMFMIAGGQAQSAAKATKIVSGLSNVKTAVLTWYGENTDKIKNDGTINAAESAPSAYFTAEKLSKYLNAGKDFTIGALGGNYQVIKDTAGDNKPAWYACYHLESKPDKKDVIARLYDKALAQRGHLLQKSESGWEDFSNNPEADKIYMEILIFNY